MAVESERAVEQVRRLIQRARARPAGAIRGVTRQLAWDRLTRASGNWPEPERRWAASQVLKDWADAGAPDDDAPLTALVVAWAGSEEFAALVMKGAAGQLIVSARACKEYCVRHGLAPDDPVDRARFYAMTDQPEQRRALDPDGSLIATAYQAEGAAGRAVLRDVLGHEAKSAAAGDGSSPDLMRVITGGGTRESAELADEERGYLRQWLLARRDWDGLWDLTRGLPPLKAAAELREFPAAWRPTAERDRSLISALSQADPASLRRALDALTDVGVIHIEVPGNVRTGALSDDGQRLAVWTHDTAPSGSAVWPHPPPSPGTIRVYRLPDVALLARHSATIWHDASLAYAGRELAAFTVRFGRDSNEAWLRHCPEDAQPMELAFHDEGDRGRGTVAMAAYGDGYVTASLDHTLSFHSAVGRRIATQRYELPSFRGQVAGYIGMAAEISVDQASGRIAVMRDYYGVLLDGQARSETHIPRVGGIEQHVGWHHIAMQGADVLLTSEGSGILRWDLSGYRKLSYFDEGLLQYRKIDLPGVGDMVWIPSTGELCCTSAYLGDSGNVYYVDGQTYAALPGRRPLTGKKASVLVSSPAGTCYALGGDGFADVVLPEHMAAQALKALADRPLSAWRAADARAVQQTMRLADRESRFRLLLNLLTACGDYSRAPGDEPRSVRLGPSPEATA
jgi:hypothetical protein